MENLLDRETGRADARLLALTGLFAALGCAGTMVIQVPSPTGGYTNLGETMVLLGAYVAASRAVSLEAVYENIDHSFTGSKAKYAASNKALVKRGYDLIAGQE